MAWIGAQVGQERAERQLAGVARYQVAVALRVLELLDEPAPRVGAAALSAAEGCVSRAAERVVDDEGTFEERARRLRKVRPALLDGLLASMFAPGPSLLDETRTARAWVLVWVAVEAIELARGQRGTNERESA
ncbi:MAG: hypothetical protein H6738_24580 [Alphaproteobacteria bacterium]|nr:hypothetical protein [Alphaproteobacteria bacterium]MCB9699987.1 hypothetical protein [Alphaproteobacteria bacterium]